MSSAASSVCSRSGHEDSCTCTAAHELHVRHTSSHAWRPHLHFARSCVQCREELVSTQLLTSSQLRCCQAHTRTSLGTKSLEESHSLALPVHSPQSGHGGSDVALVGSALASEADPACRHQAMVLHQEHACVDALPSITACGFIYHVKPWNANRAVLCLANVEEAVLVKGHELEQLSGQTNCP